MSIGQPNNTKIKSLAALTLPAFSIKKKTYFNQIPIHERPISTEYFQYRFEAEGRLCEAKYRQHSHTFQHRKILNTEPDIKNLRDHACSAVLSEETGNMAMFYRDTPQRAILMS